jgi:hypothetical protein
MVHLFTQSITFDKLFNFLKLKRKLNLAFTSTEMLDTRVITSCTSEVFKLEFKIPLLIVLRWLHDLVMHLITYTQKLIEYNTVTKHFALFCWESTFDKVVSVMHLNTHNLSLR